MNRRKGIYVLIGGAAVFVAAICGRMMWNASIPVEIAPTFSRDPSILVRGARVVAQGDCVVCHTAVEGAPYAGGLALRTPFGAIYSTNITPDPRTGIGGWSLAAFRRALRDGVSRDGHFLYPAFPYVHYTHLSDLDISDAYSFLMSRPAISAPPQKNGLPLVFQFRPSLAFWNLLYLRRHVLPSNGSSVARGRYLVEGAGHCSSCHTPLDFIGGERERYAYSGAEVDGWQAPPLNRLIAAPVAWTKEELISYFSTGLAPHHGAAAGPMKPVIDNMARLPTEDLSDIADYILTIQTAEPFAPTSLQKTEFTSNRRGGEIFEAACGACHESAAPMMALNHRPSLAQSTAIRSDDPRDTLQTILSGIGWPEEPKRTLYMPPFEHVLSDQDLADLTEFLRVQFAAKPGWPDIKKAITAVRHSRG